MREYPTNIPDVELAAACCAGERQAQRLLFERMRNPMFGLCIRFSDNRQSAEDLLQEGFIQVFNHICQYRGEGSLNGWVRKVFVRTALENLQRRQKQPEFLDLEWLAGMEDDTPDDPSNPDHVVRMMQMLPPGFRTVLNLYVLEEKSHEEIARELGIEVSTSRSQLARAKAFLKKLLQKTQVIL